MKEVTSYCVPCESNFGVRTDADIMISESLSEYGIDNVLSAAAAGIWGGTMSKSTFSTATLCVVLICLRKGRTVAYVEVLERAPFIVSASWSQGGLGKLLSDISLGAEVDSILERLERPEKELCESGDPLSSS